MTRPQSLTVMDLFAGCGGLGLGLEKAGFLPIFVNELSDDARETYLVNREQRFPLLRKYSSRDILDLVRKKEAVLDLVEGLRRDYGIQKSKGVDLVVGGPPCQGYSSIGRRRSYDVTKRKLASNHLYKHMATLIKAVKPRAFLFENVEGLLYSRWTENGVQGEVFADVLEAFQSIPDYSVRFSFVKSKDYGVPQNRPRVFVVGIRSDIFQPLSGTGDAIEAGFLPRGSGKYPNLEDVLSDLIDDDFEYGGRTERYPKKARTEFQERMRACTQNHAALYDHEYSRHSPATQKKFAYMIRTGAIHHAHKTKKFNQRLLPRHWGPTGPNITITSLPDDFVHFEQARSLTVRECARIQTFPDWYRFVGPRTTGGHRRAGNPLETKVHRVIPRYTQIGNAVPVDLAEAIGKHLAKILRI